MNATTRLTNQVGWMLCALLGGVLTWMLTGCTTYQDHPRARGGYYEDQPGAGVALNKKGKEQEASPENPDVSPQSPL